MFAGFRRHQKWIWAAVIAVIIPSFVIFFTQTGNLPSVGGGGGQYGSLNSRPITQEEFYAARKEANLSFFFRYGDWPERQDLARRANFNAMQETYTRLLLAEKVREFGITVSPESVAKWVRDNVMDPQRNIFGVSYDRFVREVLRKGGCSGDDFERWVRNTVGIQQLVSLAGLGGRLVTPQEAEALYRQEHEEVSTEAVFFHASNYLASVTATPEALSQFHSNRLSAYFLPERVEVNYVKFEATNYFAEADRQLAQVTNLTQQVEMVYLQQGTNFYKDATGNPLPPDAAKVRVREELRLRQAVLAARRVASEFAIKVLESPTVTNLDLVARAYKLPVKSTAPFGLEGPTDIKVGESFATAAFALTPEEPIAPATLPADDGVYVIALKQKYQRKLQDFEAVRDRVTEDYRREQSQELAFKAAEEFHRTLTNGLAQGRAFAVICAEAKVKPQALPAFSASTRLLDANIEDLVSLRQLQSTGLMLRTGQASGVEPIRTGMMVLYLRSRLPASEAKLKEDLPVYTARLRQYRQGAVFEEWLQRQFQSGSLSVPKGVETEM
jgi:hypothetical protein